MKLDREQGPGHLIRGFAAGRILIGSETFSSPLILTAERIIADWSPPGVQQLSRADLQRVLDLDPDVILLGTGLRQLFPPATLTTEILRQGVGLEIMNTAAACRTFNVLASEYRRVAAALFIE